MTIFFVKIHVSILYNPHGQKQNTARFGFLKLPRRLWPKYLVQPPSAAHWDKSP